MSELYIVPAILLVFALVIISKTVRVPESLYMVPLGVLFMLTFFIYFALNDIFLRHLTRLLVCGTLGHGEAINSPKGLMCPRCFYLL